VNFGKIFGFLKTIFKGTKIGVDLNKVNKDGKSDVEITLNKKNEPNFGNK
jgi:hypothetical protein